MKQALNIRQFFVSNTRLLVDICSCKSLAKKTLFLDKLVRKLGGNRLREAKCSEEDAQMLQSYHTTRWYLMLTQLEFREIKAKYWETSGSNFGEHARQGAQNDVDRVEVKLDSICSLLEKKENHTESRPEEEDSGERYRQNKKEFSG